MYNGINEREIETPFTRKHAEKHHARFIKGPIPLRQVCIASQLPGKALAVLLAVYHRVALTREDQVSLPAHLLTDLGISKDAKARAVKALEQAGLITTEHGDGRSVLIKLQPEN